MCIRMGFTCLRDIAQATRIPYDADPDPDQPIALTEAAFYEAYDRLVAVGMATSRPRHEAWPHFRGWRVNYETLAYHLAYRLDAPPAKWTGPRRQFASESLEPVRPTDRQPTSVPPGARGINREPETRPDGPQL
jgi:hypothetical protein